MLGLDNLCPQFGWTLPHSTNRRQPHEVQSAAEVVVRNTQGVQIWSSGRVLTTAPRLVPNASLPLTSDTAYTWSVRVWSTRDHPTAFAIPANFTTGLLVQADWGNATWIVGGSLLRTEFVVPDGAVERVSLFVSACQYYMLYLDGRRVGDHELDVAWTKYADMHARACLGVTDDSDRTDAARVEQYRADMLSSCLCFLCLCGLYIRV